MNVANGSYRWGMPAPILVVTGSSGVGKSTITRRVGGSFKMGVRLPIDDMEALIVAGRVQQSSPKAGHQNHVLGGAVAAAAMQFAVGDYTTVIDGVLFPHVLAELARACHSHGVELHYAVLRAPFSICVDRAERRNQDRSIPSDIPALKQLHERFADVGDYEENVVHASDPPEPVAARLLARYAEGQLRVSVAD